MKPKQPSIDVTVSGDDETVSKLKKNDFHAAVNVSGLDEGKHDVPVEVEGPSDIDIKSSQKDATVDITK
ncbi:CdaR family protein [Virgibacillus sp. 179-BFC.A HS]|uniref:CdaR family protein n=1 Tax=Tigheibacillus jepli TaxID=3035914 RepID=A0ABU5CMV1_9BACI|nr:CdaR family protein [Virgibacillus sp. 179-BFC.A HS]MDY0407129.1 CdaR family protein [Virgibacillus sp. 179-BFC.A HS]